MLLVFQQQNLIKMKISSIGILLILLSLNCVFGQAHSIQWKDLPNENAHVFPQAYINGSSSVEKAINSYLQDTYLNHEDSYRDSFYEYGVLSPTANICGVSISYEHMFNTAPGIWSFTDYQYFDARSGEKLTLDKFFHENGEKEFLRIMNERKNDFVNKFKATLNKDREDYDKMIEIVEYTLNDHIKLNDIEGHYRVIIESGSISLNKDWEYAWGIGRHELPYMTLECSFEEMEPLLNDYGRSLLFGSKVASKK